ncbi:MAG: LPXTG cell wall anchor domain-containing protein, partial [Intestinibacter sp.]
MRFFNIKMIDKTKLKPNKSSIQELLFLIYTAFILFLVTEILSARGTTSYGFIENSTIYLGIGLLLILPLSMIFVFKKNKKNYYIGEAVLILLMIPLMKYIWDKFYIFLDIPEEQIWCLLLDYLVILAILTPAVFLKKKIFYCALVSGILMLLSLCNYAISIFRGIPLAYCDVYCIGDALPLVDDFLGKNNIILVIIGLALLLLGLALLFIKEKRKTRFTSYINIIVAITICAGMYSYYLKLVNDRTLIYYSANMVKTYRYNGYVYSTIESC